jgi:hypothetical protein
MSHNSKRSYCVLLDVSMTTISYLQSLVDPRAWRDIRSKSGERERESEWRCCRYSESGDRVSDAGCLITYSRNQITGR